MLTLDDAFFENYVILKMEIIIINYIFEYAGTPKRLLV